jgi:hypothetical protein
MDLKLEDRQQRYHALPNNGHECYSLIAIVTYGDFCTPLALARRF